MRISELIDSFRDEVGDAAEPYLWSDPMLMRFLNEAEREAADRARLIKDSATAEICSIALVADTSLYALDPRVLFIHEANLTSTGKRIRRITTREVADALPSWKTHKGSVEYYLTDFQYGKLRLFRIPTANDTLELRVSRLPLADMMARDSSPEIPLRYHAALLHWVKFKAYSVDDSEVRDDAKAKKYLGLFEAEFGPKRSAWADQFDQEMLPSDELEGGYN